MFPGPNPKCKKCGREGSPYNGITCNACRGYYCTECIMRPTFVGNTVKLHGEVIPTHCPVCRSTDIVNLMNIIY